MDLLNAELDRGTQNSAEHLWAGQCQYQSDGLFDRGWGGELNMHLCLRGRCLQYSCCPKIAIEYRNAQSVACLGPNDPLQVLVRSLG